MCITVSFNTLLTTHTLFVKSQLLVDKMKDNLTEGLTRWKDEGVKKEDLAALTLYRDFWDEFVNSDTMLDTTTSIVQMKQGKKTPLEF